MNLVSPDQETCSPDDSWFVVVDPVGYHRPWSDEMLAPAGWNVVDGKMSCQNARKRADELNYVEEIMKS